ncbi:hypothetical protein MHH33_13980 [Paenisporosarcina sp. FSL H8-0542]|uniref:hypothetical protein n=1 Tax=Paenisporosarcina sp. FSL H8-0542 TaxID=2921401 RepID=UPI00315A0F56
MKKVFIGFNAFLGAFVTTLVILVLSFLYMLFSDGGKLGKRTVYFDTLFFDSADKADGSVSLHFGVENYLPAILTVIILTIFYMIVFFTYKLLRQKQIQLKNSHN